MKKLPKLLALITISIYSTHAMADTLHIKPGSVFTPRVIENARDLIHLYPSSDLITLPELSRDEEQKIVDLIQDKSRTYVAIKRNVSVSIDNWEFVGSKNSSDIWQLHIKSPDAIAMQAYFYEATLFSELDIKVYAGEEGITSHIGEHKGNNLGNAESFWSTKVPGNTIVIEVWAPQNRNLAPAAFPFEIKYINHYFREGSGDATTLKHFTLGESQQINPCPFENNLCNFGDNQDVWRAITKFYYTAPNNDSSQCTGSFLNNRKADSQLLLLTAFHCIYPGSSENMAKGSAINAQIETSISPCASADDQLVGNDIKFIAGSEKADWALLWVNASTLARKDGLSLAANAPALLGSNFDRLAVGSLAETLHHAAGTEQNYAQFRVTRLAYSAGDIGSPTSIFEECRNPSGCTHYRLEATIGGTEGGASGASLWSPRYQVRAIHTDGDENASCISFASRIDKMAEDGRFMCALEEGAAYYPDNTAACNDSSRPSYSNAGGDAVIVARNDGGGGGFTGLGFIALLAFCFMGLSDTRQRVI